MSVMSLSSSLELLSLLCVNSASMIFFDVDGCDDVVVYCLMDDDCGANEWTHVRHVLDSKVKAIVVIVFGMVLIDSML